MIVFNAKGTVYAYIGLICCEIGTWQYGWAPALVALGAWLVVMGAVGE